MNRIGLLLCILPGLYLGTACGSDDDGPSSDAAIPPDGPSSDAAAGSDGGPDSGGGTPVEARPYDLIVPDGYDPATPTPLVVVLHGYTSSGAAQLAYFGFEAVAHERTLLVAYPDGLLDVGSNRFWNATDACCDFGSVGDDDVTYLTAVIDDVAAKYNVDEARVFLLGHSNGGFMSHRMACDRADRIAAIVSLAGAGWADESRCQPSEAVAILQIHGTTDDVIRFDGGAIFNIAYPSVADTVGDWAARNGCTGALETTTEHMDLDTAVADDETRIDRYAGCPDADAAVELWVLEGSGHVPGLNLPEFPNAVVDFMLAHPKQ